MTFHEGQQHIVDPEASLRAELTGAIAAAQIDIANAIAELARSGADSAALTNQSHALQQLQRSVGSANLGSLLALRGEIAVAVATTQTIAQQSRANATATEQAASLTTASAEVRRTVQSIGNDLFERKLFDPYLAFGSAEEEAAYRRREAERQQAMASEFAKGTPTGNLNAAGIAIGQMADAKARGAGNSPEFESGWNELVKTTQRLRDEIARTGGSTQEFDDRLRADLRGIMKSKGLSDAEIDARLMAQADNPLEAAKAYVASNDELDTIRRSTHNARAVAERPSGIVTVSSTEQSHPDHGMADALAKLQGISLTDAADAHHGGFAHGLSVQGNGPTKTGRKSPS